MAVAGKLQVAAGSLIVESLARSCVHVRVPLHLGVLLPRGILPQEVAAELPDTWTPVL